MEKSKEKSRNLMGWIPIISMLIAVGALFVSIRSCSHDSEQDAFIKEMQYVQNTMNYHPRIVFKETPVITRCMIDTAMIHIDMNKFIEAMYKGEAPYIDMQYQLLISYKFIFTNIGESLGKLVAIVSADTLSSIPVIRNKLLGDYDHISSFRPFGRFSKSELLPFSADTIHWEHTEKVTFFFNNEFAVHVAIFYENELGQLFDTYYIQHCTVTQGMLPYMIDRGKLHLGDISKATKIFPDEFFPSYHIYESNDGASIKNKFEKYGRQFLNEMNN